MMGGVELMELADSIKQYGLANPIVTDLDGKLVIDGRNRQRGCEIAGVVPRYVPIDPAVTDLTAWVVLQNVKRRNLTAGQRAVAAARAWTVAEKEGRISKEGRPKNSPQQGELIKNPRVYFGKMFGAGKDQVEQAKALVDNDAVGVDAIMNGKTLAEVFHDYELRIGKDRNEAIRRQKLAAERPDLMDKVDRAELKFEAAEQLAAKEAAEQKQQRWALTMNLLDGAKAFDRDLERVDEIAGGYDPAQAEGRGEYLTPERLRRIAAFAEALAKTMEGGID